MPRLAATKMQLAVVRIRIHLLHNGGGIYLLQIEGLVHTLTTNSDAPFVCF